MADLLAELDRRYPTARREYRQFRNRRGQDGLPSWPDWCYVPLAGAAAVVSAGELSSLRFDQAQEIGRVGALMAWRVRRGVWPISPLLWAALGERELAEDTPLAPLYRLPEPCVYLAPPTPLGPILGAYVHLEHDANTRRPELRLLLDTTGSWDGLLPVPLLLDGGTLSGIHSGILPGGLVDVREGLEPGTLERSVAATLHLCLHGAELEHRL